jgi:predicted metal-dependent peptidase
MRDRDSGDIFSVYKRILLEAAKNTGEPDKKGVTPEQIDRLVKLKIALETRVPLFSKLIRLAPVIFTYDLPTMAVDGNDNLYINPVFFDRLTDEGVQAVLAHEMYHIFHEHVKDALSRGMDGRLHNFATDYVINRDLVEYGLDLKNLTKDKNKPVSVLLPFRRPDGKFILSIGNKNFDVTHMGVDQLYNLIYAEAERQNLLLKDILDKLKKDYGENEIDEEDPRIPPQEEEKKHVFQVGDIVTDINSDIKGTVIKASPPDENGNQILDIDWDTSVNETYKYIVEEIEKSVSSTRIRPFKKSLPPPPGGDPGPPPPGPKPPGPVGPPPPGPKPPGPKGKDKDGKDGKDKDGKDGKDKDGKDKDGKDKDGKDKDGKDKDGKDKDGKCKDGKCKDGKGGKAPKPAEGQDVAPRSEPLSEYDKQEIRREGEYYTKKLQKDKNINISGKGNVNWKSVLDRLVRQATQEVSTFLPDVRSIGAGRFIRGTKRLKEKLSLFVMVDASGSINESIYHEFINEVINIVKKSQDEIEINLLLWDHAPYSGTKYFHITKKDYSKLLSAPLRGGNTAFDNALKFYSAHAKELKNTKAVIVFTDGGFNGQTDGDKNLLNTYIDRKIPVIFCLFKPFQRDFVDMYNRPNKTVIETTIELL